MHSKATAILHAGQWSLAAIVAFGVTACSNPPAKTAEPPADRPGSPPQTAYVTFDAVWETVDQRHFDPEHNGVDWVAVREEFRPRIEETRNEEEVRMILSQMLSKLGQSHFVIIPGDRVSSETSEDTSDQTNRDAAQNDDQADSSSPDDEETSPRGDGGPASIGFRLGFVDEQPTVIRIESGSSAEKLGIQPGWVVETVNGRSLKDRFSRIRQAVAESGSSLAEGESAMMLEAISRGRGGGEATIEFMTFDGEKVEHTIEFEELDAPIVKFGNLPEMPVVFESNWISPDDMSAMGVTFNADDPPSIGYIYFNNWMFPIMAPLADAVDEFRSADGIVLDLRRNPGGLGGLAMGAAGHFINEAKSLGSMISRKDTLEFVVNPQRATMDGRLVEPYAGPLVIIVDAGTASTSEIFGAGLKQLGRAHIVGRQSMGAALPAHTMKLPNGDVFMHAVANFIGPDEESVEETGVVPDQFVTLTRENLMNEKDPDLKTAVDWILENPSR